MNEKRKNRPARITLPSFTGKVGAGAPAAEQSNLKKARTRYRFRLLVRPGQHMRDGALAALVARLRDTASRCFHTVPEYQALTGLREELADTVIAVALRPDGTMAGFCSTVILDVEGVGVVQHLGLTCVRPEDRSNGLTHELTRRAVAGFLLRHRPVAGKLWISNCAAVLSSLVNVSMHFEEVYPSPAPGAAPSAMHRAIAEAIDRRYRRRIFINDNAIFDPEGFVFRGSVKDTVFQKSGEDTSMHHRRGELNEFYRRRMSFENGDEVLQVGYATTLAALRHMVRKFPFPVASQKGPRPARASVA
ncbi:MAG: hypothetical protein JW838_14130 [Spirochaetes bacterium]|nr:hypothetical protein [Spirochaetota bacterium]